LGGIVNDFCGNLCGRSDRGWPGVRAWKAEYLKMTNESAATALRTDPGRGRAVDATRELRERTLREGH